MRRQRRLVALSSVKSCILSKPKIDVQHLSKSEVLIQPATAEQKMTVPFFEKNIGDHAQNHLETETKTNMTGVELLQSFVKKRDPNSGQSSKMPINFDARSLFSKRYQVVPHNSDAESD